jgi:DNA-binding CsgD family transcriptional regulator
VAQKDGISLIENKLTFQGTQDSLQIQSIITEVLDAHLNKQAGMVKACRLTRPSGRADLGIVVRAVPTSAWSEGQSSPAIALFISDPEQQFCTSQNTLVELFNLSPAEAALALLLTRGLTLADASDELNISQHTARAQLKSIFLKSGVTRQAELIRLIVKSVADLA